MQGTPVYCLHGIRRTDSMTCILGYLWEHGNSTQDAKGATKSGNTVRSEYRSLTPNAIILKMSLSQQIVATDVLEKITQLVKIHIFAKVKSVLKQVEEIEKINPETPI
jgi:hypothetical protein